MNAQDISFLKEFQLESQQIVVRLVEILDLCEGDFAQVKRLEEYGQSVDRIMGAAKTIATALETGGEIPVQQIGDYAALCKAVGYKASQIKDNAQFYEICVALLQDVTEVLLDLVDNLLDAGSGSDLKQKFSKAFIDRLKWVSEQFGAEYRATLDLHGARKTKMNQNDIDELLKKLGLD